MQKPPLKIIAGSLTALSFACVLSCVSVDHLSCSLKIALTLFSISIPFNIFLLTTPSYRSFTSHDNLNKTIYYRTAITFIPLNLAGIVFVFGHFGCIFAFVFLLASLIAFALYSWRARRLDEEEGTPVKKGNDDNPVDKSQR